MPNRVSAFLVPNRAFPTKPRFQNLNWLKNWSTNVFVRRRYLLIVLQCWIDISTVRNPEISFQPFKGFLFHGLQSSVHIDDQKRLIQPTIDNTIPKPHSTLTVGLSNHRNRLVETAETKEKTKCVVLNSGLLFVLLKEHRNWVYAWGGVVTLWGWSDYCTKVVRYVGCGRNVRGWI